MRKSRAHLELSGSGADFDTPAISLEELEKRERILNELISGVSTTVNQILSPMLLSRVQELTDIARKNTGAIIYLLASKGGLEKDEWEKLKSLPESEQLEALIQLYMKKVD